jgi:hypothetical protein
VSGAHRDKQATVALLGCLHAFVEDAAAIDLKAVRRLSQAERDDLQSSIAICRAWLDEFDAVWGREWSDSVEVACPAAWRGFQ